jgi:ABC-type nitrate/sulfonate/bicarbonate transport system substrate-binding protein
MRIYLSMRSFIAAMIAIFLYAHAPEMVAAQAKPLVKILAGYGSTDGAIAPLWFAKETKLFEKRGLDVRLVGMGTGAVSLRALIARDLGNRFALRLRLGASRIARC